MLCFPVQSGQFQLSVFWPWTVGSLGSASLDVVPLMVVTQHALPINLYIASDIPISRCVQALVDDKLHPPRSRIERAGGRSTRGILCAPCTHEVLHTSFPCLVWHRFNLKRTPILASGTQDVSEPRWPLNERETEGQRDKDIERQKHSDTER